MNQRILHISDWHGSFLSINQQYDIVVCSGDMLPNSNRGSVEHNEAYQPVWIRDNIENFRGLIGDRPFLFCPGNHDYVDLCAILRTAGMNAIEITDRVIECEGLKFYGFPYVPYIAGEWNFECTPYELNDKVNALYDIVPGIDILVSHCPMTGFLDTSTDGHIGNSHLSNMFYYGGIEFPKAILCGHIHEGRGYVKHGNCHISNAATTHRIIEILK